MGLALNHLRLWDDYGVPGAQVELPPEHIVRLYSHKPD